MSTTEESNLVIHARTELERIGQFEEDREYAESIVESVRAFSGYGHSGGSAMCAVSQLERLLRFKPLGPLTDDPGEWNHIEEEMAGDAVTWQSRRNPACFSNDGGKTYYDLDEAEEGVSRTYHRSAPA